MKISTNYLVTYRYDSKHVPWNYKELNVLTIYVIVAVLVWRYSSV